MDYAQAAAHPHPQPQPHHPNLHPQQQHPSFAPHQHLQHQPFPYHHQQGQPPVSPSPSPYPPDPRHRFPGPQQNPQNQWNGAVASPYPVATTSMNGPMAFAGNGMPPPNMAQQQQQQQQQSQQQQQQQRMQGAMPQSPFTSAPYAQGTPSSAPQKQPNMFPSTPQNHPPNSNQVPGTVSRTNSGSAPNQPTAIQTSQPQGSQGSQLNTPQSATTPGANVSAEERARHQKRVAVMLEMNNDILVKLMDLQKGGKAGPEGQGVPTKPEDVKEGGNSAAPEYIDSLKCLQSNLAYLGAMAQSKPQPGPAIMEAPATLPDLTEHYAKLKPLFPGWTGAPARPSPTQGNTALPGKQPVASTAAT